MEDKERAISKILKRLSSVDDNDKLAALSYIIKLYKDPETLRNSAESESFWHAIRSTSFLERALKVPDLQEMVFSILEIFSPIISETDAMLLIIPLFSLLPGSVHTLCVLISKLSSANEVLGKISLLTGDLDTSTMLIASIRRLDAVSDLIRLNDEMLNLIRSPDANSYAPNLLKIFYSLGKATKWRFPLLIFSDSVSFELFNKIYAFAISHFHLKASKPNNNDKADEDSICLLVLNKFMKPLLLYEDEFSDEDIDKYLSLFDSLAFECMFTLTSTSSDPQLHEATQKSLLVFLATQILMNPCLSNSVHITRSIDTIFQLLKVHTDLQPMFTSIYPLWEPNLTAKQKRESQFLLA